MQTDTNQRRSPCTLTVISLLAVLMSLTAGCSDQQPSAPQQTQSTEAPAIQEAEQETTPPVAAPEPAAATSGTEASGGEGESVYQKACKNCHDAGIANAPKLSDSAAWAPRIEKGNDALLESVKNGLNAMPPRGGCMTCSDEELRSAMEYMVSQGS